MRRCPYCDEEIRENAMKCKHCGSMLNDTIGGLATMAPGGGASARLGTAGAMGSDPSSSSGTDWGDTLDGMATLTPESLTEGQVLAGRYRLDSIIGAGGMGIVWRATDNELDQVVAVKVLPGVLSRNARAIESLKAEAKLSLKLAHANICRLTNFHSDGNIKFLIMEYLDGQTLEALLASRPSKKLTLEQLRRIAQQIGQALDYAHQLSPPVQHRDIKPANIMITADGSAKLLDFGIAREIKDTMTQVTGKVETAGTLPYMSPEQFRGSKMTTASDVYSFAAVLYECLAGKPYVTPHGDPSYQILQRPYEPITDQTENINTALNAALDKSAIARPKSASDILKTPRSFVSKPSPSPLETPREASVRAISSRESTGRATQECVGRIVQEMQYKVGWVTIALLIFCFPVGLYRMFTAGRRKEIRIDTLFVSLRGLLQNEPDQNEEYAQLWKRWRRGRFMRKIMVLVVIAGMLFIIANT